ncbi:hypothetical protein HMI56_000298 [Coelomomyces lativittatus]|nr:hypothetical protein HMI56_000298 [Coelomomyces lativittatus]
MKTVTPEYYTGLTPSEILHRASFHHATGKPPPSNYQITKEKFFQAEQDASPEFIQGNSSLEKRREEKQRLHQKSIEMVSKWNNTISGQRKYRLAAQLEKAKLLELQHVQIDNEWTQLKEKERSDMCHRAKQLQYMEDVQVRQLHSQALMTQVLKERQAQVAYQKNRRIQAHQDLQRYMGEQRQSLSEYQEHMYAEQRQRQQRQWDMAKVNQQLAMEKKQNEANAASDRKNAVFYVPIFTTPPPMAAGVVKEALDQGVLEKLNQKRQCQLEEKELVKQSLAIQDVKLRLAQKRLEKEKEMIRERVLRNEYVASHLVPIHESKETARTLLLHQLEHAHEGVYEKQQEEKRLQRASALQECTKALQGMIEEKKKAASKDIELGYKYRTQNEKVAESGRKSAEVRQQKKKVVQQQFGETYRQVIAQQRQKHQLEHAQALKTHCDTLESQHSKDVQFQTYATELIETFQKMGNDTRCMEKLVVSPIPLPSSCSSEKIKVRD